jgi:hypothetical protein
MTLKQTNTLVNEWNWEFSWQQESPLGRTFQTRMFLYLLGKNHQGWCQDSWVGGRHRRVKFLERSTENRKKAQSSLWKEADKRQGERSLRECRLPVLIFNIQKLKTRGAKSLIVFVVQIKVFKAPLERRVMYAATSATVVSKALLRAAKANSQITNPLYRSSIRPWTCQGK